MGKRPERPEVKPLPPTKAETAKERLEELINHDSVESTILNPRSYYNSIKGGKLKLYPDGHEAVFKTSSLGMLYIKNIDLLVWYNLNKEYEKQDIRATEEK